jgi:hypothetical protein
MSQAYYCQIKNNSELNVTTVVISNFGQNQFTLTPDEVFLVRLMEGKKVVITWNNETGDLLDFHCIQVGKPALFRLLLSLPKSVPVMSVPTNGGPSRFAAPAAPAFAVDPGETPVEGVSSSIVDTGT